MDMALLKLASKKVSYEKARTVFLWRNGENVDSTTSLKEK